MSQPSTSRSHFLAWTFAVLIAAPLLYVITLPPIVGLAARNKGGLSAAPRWLVYYATPGDWLFNKSALKGTLKPYSKWWFKQMGVNL